MAEVIRPPLFTPTAARDLHRNLTEWWQSAQAQRMVAMRNDSEIEQGVSENHAWFRAYTADVHRRRLMAAETFLVTDEMSAVVRHAAATLPAIIAEHSMLPAECGFLVFNDRLNDHDRGNIPTEFVHWYPMVDEDGKAGVAISTYVTRWAIANVYTSLQDARHEAAQAKTEIGRLESVKRVAERALAAAEAGDELRARDLRRAAQEMGAEPDPVVDKDVDDIEEQLAGFDALRAPVFPALWGFLPYGEEPAYWRQHADDNITRAARMTLAAWLLMDEALAVREKPRIERAAAKRAVRAGLTSDLTVIRLRQPKTAPGEHPSSREYHSRWLVRGHWRRIPTPEHPHRVTWVHGYVKGPVDAPLVVKDRVTVLQR